MSAPGSAVVALPEEHGRVMVAPGEGRGCVFAGQGFLREEPIPPCLLQKPLHGQGGRPVRPGVNGDRAGQGDLEVDAGAVAVGVGRVG